jgi:hypothetical protein
MISMAWSLFDYICNQFKRQPILDSIYFYLIRITLATNLNSNSIWDSIIFVLFKIFFLRSLNEYHFERQFLIHNITTKNYYKYCRVQKTLIIAGMKLIFVFTFNPHLFYFKSPINNEITIQVILDTDFLKTLKNIVSGCDDKSIASLRTTFELGIGTASVKNLFSYDASFCNWILML